jgi:predicted DNA-binding WGR domain protein
MARRFEFEEGGSSKFWEVSVDGSDMTVTYGRIGTSGQTKTKSFATNEAAQKEADKLVAEKTKKGYAEVGGDAASKASAPAAKASAPAAKASAPAAKASAPAASTAAPASDASTSEPSPAPSTHASSGERTGPSMIVDGETVWFAVPSFAAEIAEAPLDRPLAKKRAQTFDKTWADLLANHAQWSNTTQKHHSYFWETDHANATAEARAIGARVKARLDSREVGEGFDVDLEAATYAAIGHSYYKAEDRPSRVLWHWVERGGAEGAVRALLRAKSWTPHSDTGKTWPKPLYYTFREAPEHAVLHTQELSALRELARALGRAAIEAPLREAVESRGHVVDRVALAWLFDDADAARAIVAEKKWTTHAQLALLVGVLDDAEVVATILPAFHGDGPDGGIITRATIRLGLPLAPHVFARAAAEQYDHRRWIPALACYPSIQAARLLVPLLENKTNRKIVSEALGAMPAEATRALTEALKKKPKYRDAIESLLSTLAAGVKAGAGEASEDEGEEAPIDALPSVLAAPPWRAKKKAAKETVIEGLVAREVPHALDLSSFDSRKLATYRQRLAYYDRYSAKTIRDGLASGAYTDASNTLGLSLEDLKALHAEGLMAKITSKWWQADSYTPGLTSMLDRHGVEALEPILAMAPNLKVNLQAELEYAGASAIAPLAVGWLGSKAARGSAYAWVRRFPRHAAAGLIPIVLGKSGTERDRASLLVAALAHAGQREVALEEAAHHGDEARAAFQALLDRDPLELVPTKIPKLPDNLENVTRPKLKQGRVISRDATTVLCEMLTFSPIDPPYTGIDHVKAACDARSLDAFVESLVRTWVANGMVPAHEWMVRAVAILGSDRSARFLFDRGRAWALDNAKQRALLSLDVLGAMGTDLALSLVGRVSRSGARQYMKDRAVEVLAEIADARGLSPEELEDRTAPDLGLDENGSMHFDFGPRAFRAGFDEHLRPFVQSADGSERLDSFPRAQKTDDATKAKLASEAWKELKSEAEKVSKDQIARLERLMADERRIASDVFIDAFVKHPLVGHLAKRLVWGAFDAKGALLGTFRVAEDRTLATVDDDLFELPEGARVGLVHPYTLRDTPNLVARWGQQLADYAIAQPFGQLTRAVVELEPQDLASRYANAKSMSGLLFGLRTFGWRALVQEYGDIEGYERTVGSSRVVLGMNPWLRQGESKEHTITVRVYTTEGQTPPTPVQMSELVFQLDGVVMR